MNDRNPLTGRPSDAISTMIAMVPLFLGMLIVFPVLGHASWHLCKRAVEPVSG
jgi:uncharacterized membrane protein